MNDLENNILQELLKAPRTWIGLLNAFPDVNMYYINLALEHLELKGFVRYRRRDGMYLAVVNEVRVLDDK